MSYLLDQNYDFVVLPPEEDYPDSFVLQVKTPAGMTAKSYLPKLDFQKEVGRKTPEVLTCRVKGFDEDGIPMLTHVVSQYVYELYERAYAKGEPFEATVIYAPAEPTEEPYIVRDKYGIFYRLKQPDGLLAKGQNVLCKFVRLTSRFFQLERVDEGRKMPFRSLPDLLDEVRAPRRLQRFLNKNLNELPELEGVRAEYRAKNPQWVLTAARTVLNRLPEWLKTPTLRRKSRVARQMIQIFRSILLHLLEGSSFLNAVPTEQRRALQQQLTENVENLKPFDTTLKMIQRGEQDSFVEKLFEKLTRSGYLYHPGRQFSILMLIFRLYPEKVGSYLSRIFESIFSRDLDNWNREPFRSAFVEQFEMYVRQARRAIDALPVAETREQKSHLETIIIAIALHLILSDVEADARRMQSLFFRYISLLRPLKSEDLLSKSFLALMGADTNSRLSYEQLREPMMMMTSATVLDAERFMDKITNVHKFSNGNIDVEISSDGILISQTGRHDVTERVITSGLMPWLNPQILLNGIRSLTGAAIRRLSEHERWWADIETALFPPTAGRSQDNQEESGPVRPKVDDDVYIVVERTEDYYSGSPVFVCRIQDEYYEEAYGFLPREEIVGYQLAQPSDRAFHSRDGSKLGFFAKIIGENEDGTFQFSLKDEVNKFIYEELNCVDEYVVVITGVNARDYSAISNIGIGLFVERDLESHSYSPGDIVRIRLTTTGPYGNVRGYVVADGTPADSFGKNDAFIHLMHGIGLTNSETETEELNTRDLDEVLAHEDIRELIEILRFKAVTESDLTKAYDYLRYARLLARTIADERLAQLLLTHASLLTLHQYYAINSRIDPEKLEVLRARAEGEPMLNMLFHRLEMVSWLGNTDKNARLYDTVNNHVSELEGVIARLVLSYNMINDDYSDGENAISTDIREKIKEKLNVNSESRTVKYYGSESKYLEFKTSLVYPAGTPGEKMREEPEKQQFHIMSRIAGMLNAAGGVLYLGVNNDGFEVGLRDDMKYYERHPVSVAGMHRTTIQNLDNLCVFLENLVNYYFDAAAARKIDISLDPEAEKGVIVIQIQESVEPVFIADRLFVRQSGQSTFEYNGKQREVFLAERQELKEEREHTRAMERERLAASLREREAEEAAVTGPARAQASVATAEKTVFDEVAPAYAKEKLPTSQWRYTPLHDYEENFEEPEGYIYITKGNNLTFSRTDLWIESEPDTLLALAVPHSLADGYLVLGFDDQRCLKVPLSQVMQKGENETLHINDEFALRFACLAAKDDALMCVATDGSDTLWVRAARLSQLDVAHLHSTPRRIQDIDMKSTFGWEIIDASATDNFAEQLTAPGKRFGATLRVKAGTEQVPYKMQLLTDRAHQAQI